MTVESALSLVAIVAGIFGVAVLIGLGLLIAHRIRQEAQPAKSDDEADPPAT